MRPMPALLAVLLVALLASPARAGGLGCGDGACHPGGGDPATDCFVELRGVAPNAPYPVPDDPAPLPRTEQRCFDGDAGCDLDGVSNGVCRFALDLCIQSADPNLPACTPQAVTKLKLRRAGRSLTDAAKALPLGGGAACTDGATVDVKVKGPRSKPKPKSLALGVAATTAADVDEDTFTLTCVPREWPAAGYDQTNRRSPETAKIAPAKAPKLRLKWDFPVDGNVSSTPTVAGGLVYATSWNGVVYALDRKRGTLVWSYDTGSGGSGGVKGSATLTADGRVVVGDGAVVVHALDALTGAPLWQRELELLPQDHIWGSVTVVGNRAFVPVASDGDNPCTKGRVVALDLDTGEPLWTARTAPDRVCEDDTTEGCTTDGDCPGSRCVGMCAGDRGIACADDLECGADGPCQDAIGGGVTATPAADPSGETIYFASVGCYTGPRVGHADRFFRVRAEDGVVEWALPDFPGEPFGEGPFNDYGFLNGPIYTPEPEPTLIGASKDGKIYALDAATGAERWTTLVGDVTMAQNAFAAFGLFNGAPALFGGRLFTSLNQFGDASPAGIVHTQAFDAATGLHVWDASDDTGPTWGSVTAAGGVVFVGMANVSPSTPTEFHAFDAEDGAHLQTFPLASADGTETFQTASGPSVAGKELFIGYGLAIFSAGSGGVRAYEVR